MTVEADETELARSRKTKRPEGFRRHTHNPKVLSLVERGGNIRLVALDHKGVGKHLRARAHADGRLVTDQASTTVSVALRSTTALTTPSSNLRVATFTRTRWEVSLAS